MILYMSSHNYSQTLNGAITICNQNILKAVLGRELSLSKYISEHNDQFEFVDIFIIDLTCISDTEEEICLALNDFRQSFNSIRIIVMSPGREKDKLLSDIVSLGIYDIVISEEDQLLKDLCYCIKDGMTYKDCVQYKINTPPTELDNINNASMARVKERIIVKSEIKQSVNKALIGFIGTGERIGVTHNAIVSAFILKESGFKIAVVENKRNKHLALEQIKEHFEVEPKEPGDNFYTINQIDFYPSYSLEDLYKVFSKNYNFIIIDFGTFDLEYLAEFNRCVMPIVVCGSKPWELKQLNKIFASASEDMLKEFYYLFNYTNSENMDLIKKNMGELKKVFCADMTPDPFYPSEAPSLNMVFKDYLPSEKITFFTKITSLIKGVRNLINNIQEKFKLE
ncbi:MAG: hypothetical protein K0R34_663 [Herbinix sp.]|nr:hypothetical protein [Herbinix sp.]